MINKINLSIAAILLCAAGHASAQTAAVKKTIYLLPDSTVIQEDKLDSVANAWGKNRIMTKHTAVDDSKGIIHLVRLTDEMVKKRQEDEQKEEAVLHGLINKPAIDFTLTTLDGKQVTLSALRGKIVVLNFWFTTCPPCIQEMPVLNKLVNQYGKQNVVFLAITFNDAVSVTAFLQKNQFAYQQLTDARKLINTYAIKSYPTHIVIDKKGNVRKIMRGGEDIESMLTQCFKELL